MRIYVWNPSLRVSKTLDLNIITGLYCVTPLFFWFGRESPDEDFKLVLGIKELSMHWWCTSSDKAYRNRMYLIKPFSDDSNPESTQEIDDLYFKSFEERTLLSGIVHWLAAGPQISTDGSNYHHAVFTYDLGGKTLGKLSTPAGLDLNGAIGVIDGSLSAIYKVSRGDSAIFEVWIMKEYGVKESWTKLTVLSSAVDFSISPACESEFVGVTVKGDLIFLLSCHRNCQLLIYNVAEKKSKIVELSGYALTHMYVETLVFPRIMHRHKRLRIS
ncbi:hypothetical protein ACP275_07G072000 [Erythranthe tilingii]